MVVLCGFTVRRCCIIFGLTGGFVGSAIKLVMTHQTSYPIIPSCQNKKTMCFSGKLMKYSTYKSTLKYINSLVFQSGWGSQWFKSDFTVKMRFEEGGEEEEVTFPSAEHWMMVQKALLFKDVEMAREMLMVPDDMAAVKALGRRVQNFDEAEWCSARERIVLEGNLHKFRQNESLKAKLLATGTRRIVEASPRDRIWGIGFGEKNALKNQGRWGLNLLGLALEETRRRL